VSAAWSAATKPAATTADGGAALPRCRNCATPLSETFVDLGMSPLCERFLRADQLDEMEPFFPLHVRVCPACLLVQLPEYVAPEEIFGEYAYFSSFSTSWLAHAGRYVDMAIERFGLGPGSRVIEAASNDGYLLGHARERGLTVLGIEPARNIAEVAREQGIPTISEFLGAEVGARIAAEQGVGDLVVANNVFAHVPDIHDFSAGLAALLGPEGVLTIEIPHLVRLVEGNQFDTIYHEHFTYYTLHSAAAVLARHGLEVFDVEELPTHGGSLRYFVQHGATGRQPRSPRVDALLASEAAKGYTTLEGHRTFRPKVEATKRALLAFLVAERSAGHRIVAYGAPGKGNTLLNYCGIRTDLVEYVVDRNPYKHGRFTPGTHIPIHDVDRLMADDPDVVLILPWNLRTEIRAQLAPLVDRGVRLVVPIPEVDVLA
jgi:SAM-dependent methyltransferase